MNSNKYKFNFMNQVLLKLFIKNNSLNYANFHSKDLFDMIHYINKI
jgi:hypothetical protein